MKSIKEVANHFREADGSINHDAEPLFAVLAFRSQEARRYLIVAPAESYYAASLIEVGSPASPGEFKIAGDYLQGIRTIIGMVSAAQIRTLEHGDITVDEMKLASHVKEDQLRDSSEHHRRMNKKRMIREAFVEEASKATVTVLVPAPVFEVAEFTLLATA